MLGRYMQAQSTVNGLSEPREVERVLRETPRLYDRASLTQAARSVLTSLLDLLPRGGAGG